MHNKKALVSEMVSWALAVLTLTFAFLILIIASNFNFNADPSVRISGLSTSSACNHDLLNFLRANPPEDRSVTFAELAGLSQTDSAVQNKFKTYAENYFVANFKRGDAGRQGWTLFTPPLMATGECLMGTGFFPGAEEQTYAVDDDRYLIGTSEVSVCSYHKDELLEGAELPKRYCGFSHCFRREAGTYGKDTKGLYRVHQFQKVEQVVLCAADEDKAMALFEEIRTNAEEVLQALELPYRVVDICTGDMGRGKVFMQDIECWMPSRNSYGETHSCSYLGDFQARRLNIKYIAENGEKKFVHTLNNTCIASPRILIPLLEMYQNKDGSVTVPEVLRPYMGGQTSIRNH
ncbi:serine--tRNA ligase [Candidatus Peregrinibacteria bacterium]|nr:serine--tRNA ligase [Candidatus Peregrinibacteria bacterium]